MRAHVITGGKVANTIVVDSLDVFPGLIDAEHGGAIGDLWDGAVFARPAPDIAAQNAAIQAQIDALEQKEMASRFVRESLIVSGADLAERTAAKMTAAGTPVTKEQIMMANVGYQKLLELNQTISDLRHQLS